MSLARPRRGSGRGGSAACPPARSCCCDEVQAAAAAVRDAAVKRCRQLLQAWERGSHAARRQPAGGALGGSLPGLAIPTPVLSQTPSSVRLASVRPLLCRTPSSVSYTQRTSQNWRAPPRDSAHGSTPSQAKELRRRREGSRRGEVRRRRDRPRAVPGAAALGGLARSRVRRAGRSTRAPSRRRRCSRQRRWPWR